MQNIILISTPANMIYTIINLVITFNLLHRDVCMQLRGWEGGGGRRWVGCPCKWGSEWFSTQFIDWCSSSAASTAASSLHLEKEVTRYWDWEKWRTENNKTEQWK